MTLVRDRCICLRKTEYSETSQILTLFARQRGIVRAIARGAHRTTKAGASKFGGGIDLLDNAEAVFTHDAARDLATLTEWKLLDGHLELRTSLRAIHLGMYAAELTSRLFEEHDPHADLFDRLEATLQELATPKREEAFLAFQLDVLRESGYLPEMKACVSCGGAINGARLCCFSSMQGGIVCSQCELGAADRITLDIRLLRLVQMIMALPREEGSLRRLPRLTRHQTDPVNRMLTDHVEHTLGRRLRLPRYVIGG